MKSEEETIAKEEKRLQILEEKEKIIRDNLPEGMPIDSGRKARDIVISTQRKSENRKVEIINKILEEQGLLPKNYKKETDGISGNARRSKRYYIRKRIQDGKPYIPLHIRAQGKEAAKRLGYKKWEVRIPSPDSLPEEEVKIDKLTAFFRMMDKRKMGTFLKGVK